MKTRISVHKLIIFDNSEATHCTEGGLKGLVRRADVGSAGLTWGPPGAGCLPGPNVRPLTSCPMIILLTYWPMIIFAQLVTHDHFLLTYWPMIQKLPYYCSFFLLIWQLTGSMADPFYNSYYALRVCLNEFLAHNKTI